jgi:hypothetical protein
MQVTVVCTPTKQVQKGAQLNIAGGHAKQNAKIQMAALWIYHSKTWVIWILAFSLAELSGIHDIINRTG